MDNSKVIYVLVLVVAAILIVFTVSQRWLLYLNTSVVEGLNAPKQTPKPVPKDASAAVKTTPAVASNPVPKTATVAAPKPVPKAASAAAKPKSAVASKPVTKVADAGAKPKPVTKVADAGEKPKNTDSLQSYMDSMVQKK